MLEYLLLGITVLLLAGGQIMQKLVARKVSSRGNYTALLRVLASSFEFWTAAGLMTAALVTWLLTLSLVEVSRAYPTLASTFVVTVVISRFVLQEKMNRYRWTGVALITLGSALMMSST